MTNDEVERSIEFLLKSQASFEARLQQMNEQQARTDRQVAETGRQVANLSQRVEALSETQTEFILVVKGFMEEQAEINRSCRDSIRLIGANAEELSASQQRADERIDRLAKTVGELSSTVKELSAAQQRYDERIDRLAESVSELSSTVKKVSASVQEVSASQQRADDRIDRLADAVERFIKSGRDGDSSRQ